MKLLLILLIFLASAQGINLDRSDNLQVFFYEVYADGKETLNTHTLTIPPELTTEDRAFIMFSKVFISSQAFNPGNIRILGVSFCEQCKHLVIDLSTEILNYGGSYFEYRLINKLIKNAATLPNVNYFTILIDGQLRYLPEGTLIYRVCLSKYQPQSNVEAH